MTNPETRTQYEGAILQQLIKNAEELAVIKPKIDKIDSLEQKVDSLEQKVDSLEQKVDSLEQKVDSLEQKVDNLEQKVDDLGQKVDKIYSAIGTLKWITITIGIGIIINIFSQPIVSFLF